jgi:hypothetical protein
MYKSADVLKAKGQVTYPSNKHFTKLASQAMANASSLPG